MTAAPLGPPPEGTLRCPACSVETPTEQAVQSDHCCPSCATELAHFEISPTGQLKGVLRWLRAPGELLNDRYRVRSLLGRGGFAATYLVEDVRIEGKRRAAKEIPKGCFDDGETRVLSGLRHPAIPDITDRFEADGLVYLILEFGGEHTLEAVRRQMQGRIPLQRLRPWLDQLCDALTYIHRHDPPIVHRDLKPANVLLDDADRVMLIDFGIARPIAPAGGTRTVARFVSHGFSPPEQAMGASIDQRSDVYALGATLYALLTGTTPPPAHERLAGTELRAPRALEASLPHGVEHALLRALDLNVTRRYPTVSAFHSALFGLPPERVAVSTAEAARTIAVGSLAPIPLGAERDPIPSVTTAQTRAAGRSRWRWQIALAFTLCTAALAAWATRVWLDEGDAGPTAERVIAASEPPERSQEPPPEVVAEAPPGSGLSALAALEMHRSAELAREPDPVEPAPLRPKAPPKVVVKEPGPSKPPDVAAQPPQEPARREERSRWWEHIPSGVPLPVPVPGRRPPGPKPRLPGRLPFPH